MKASKGKVESMEPAQFLLREHHLGNGMVSKTQMRTVEFDFHCFSGVKLKLQKLCS